MIEGQQPAPIGVILGQHLVVRFLEPDRLVQVIQGLSPLGKSELVASQIHGGSTAVERRVVRFALDGLSELSNGLIRLALFLVDRRQLAIRFGWTVVEPDRRLEIRRRLVEDAVPGPGAHLG